MVTHVMSIDVGGYKHNFEDFYENFTYPMTINNIRTTMKNLYKFSRFYSFSLGEER